MASLLSSYPTSWGGVGGMGVQLPHSKHPSMRVETSYTHKNAVHVLHVVCCIPLQCKVMSIHMLLPVLLIANT